LEYLKKDTFPEVPWGAEAIVETIDITYPTTKDEILSKCGRWWAWIKPNERIRVKESFDEVEQEKFGSENELYDRIKTYFN
jgi:hypothetical protein